MNATFEGIFEQNPEPHSAPKRIMAAPKDGHDGRLGYWIASSQRLGPELPLYAPQKVVVLQISGPSRMLEQVLDDVFCRGTAAEQRVRLAGAVAVHLAVPTARANASGVEASDGLVAIVNDLGVGVDANAA